MREGCKDINKDGKGGSRGRKEGRRGIEIRRKRGKAEKVSTA